MQLQGRLGPLAEREYKRFFFASTISSFGDRVGVIALVFAVLGLTGSGTDLGLVLAARQVMEAATLLAGGVWSDRLPRQWILVGAATVQAISQAAVATLLLGGWASIPALIGLQAFYGIGGGLVGPATVGLVPLGGLLALRLRPRRPLLVSVVLAGATVLELAALALHAGTAVLSAVALVAGAAIAIHLTLWLTVFQQHIPQGAQSRVSSYDELGSFVLIPLGLALAGPASDLLGMDVTLWGAAAISAVCIATMAAIPSVRAIRGRGAPEPVVT